MMFAAVIFLAASTPVRAGVECRLWFPVWQACEALPDSPTRITPLASPPTTPPSSGDDGDDGPGKSGGGKSRGHDGHGKGKH